MNRSFPCTAALVLALFAPPCVMAENTVEDDPLVAHLADPLARMRYEAAVSASCPEFFDGFETAPPGISYVTSGGYSIKVQRHTVTVTDPSGRNTVQHWGDPHENLNGKHIKDWGGAVEWDGMHRTVLLGDGSKITMEALGPHAVTHWTSVYDGATNLQIDNCRSQIAYRGSDPLDTTEREQAQYDGETASFSTDAQTGVATYSNVYNEDNAFDVAETPVPLGTTGGYANPNQVNDLFDDPRLGHT